MAALPNTRSKGVTPMVLIVVVVGLALFTIVAVVRSVGAPASPAIEQATQAGVESIKAPESANAVSNALPPFTLSQGANEASPQNLAGWIDPAPLAVQKAGAGLMVFFGRWWDCNFIDEEYNYYPVGSGDPLYTEDRAAVQEWDQMSFGDQGKIMEACSQ